MKFFLVFVILVFIGLKGYACNSSFAVFSGECGPNLAITIGGDQGGVFSIISGTGGSISYSGGASAVFNGVYGENYLIRYSCPFGGPIDFTEVGFLYTVCPCVNPLDSGDCDEDGVLNGLDEDDDNDGISDVLENRCLIQSTYVQEDWESPVNPLVCSNWVLSNSMNGWYTSTGAPFNIIRVAGGVCAYGSAYAYSGNQYMDIAGTTYVVRDISLSKCGLISFSARFDNRDFITVNWSTRVQILNSSGIVIHQGNLVNMLNVPFNTWLESSIINAPLTAGNYKLRFYVVDAGHFDATKFCISDDSDCDGYADYIDVNSDNDGCNDVLEAYGDPNSDLENDGIYGNGIPSSIAVNSSGLVMAASYIGTNSDVTSPGGVYCSIILPVELIEFDAVKVDDRFALINWSTASEINNDYFTIERSTNGSDWLQLANIDGAGNSTSLINYSWTDDTPYHGVNYYRLSQTDMNGLVRYTEIKSLNFTTNNEVLIYPNPSNGMVSIVCKELIESIEVTDVNGNVLYKRLTEIQKDIHAIDLILNHLSSGLYFIKVNSIDYKLIIK